MALSMEKTGSDVGLGWYRVHISRWTRFKMWFYRLLGRNMRFDIRFQLYTSMEARDEN